MYTMYITPKMRACLGKKGRCPRMQVQHEKSQEEEIEALRRQVNELTTANLLLEEQLARKEQFTAMIAHEWRGPLSSISIYAQLMWRLAKRAETIECSLKTCLRW